MLFLLLSLSLALPDDTAKFVEVLRKLDQFEVHFHQETFSDFMDNTAADGVLQIRRPGKLRMSYSRGERKEFICDGTLYYERDMLADTESRLPLEDLKKEPLVRLLLFGDDPLKHFKIEAKTGPQGLFYFLKPIDAESYSLEVRLDPQGLPLELKVFGEDGEGTVFQFSDWQLNPSFGATTFVVPAETTPK